MTRKEIKKRLQYYLENFQSDATMLDYSLTFSDLIIVRTSSFLYSVADITANKIYLWKWREYCWPFSLPSRVFRAYKKELKK